MNRIQERLLKLTYINYPSSFSELLERSTTLTILDKNFQVLAEKSFKVESDIALEIMENLIMFREPSYNFISQRSSFVHIWYIMVYIQLIV